MAAGLAGGSSDAAAAMDAALEAWDAELAAVERLRIAAALGSDVPFFTVGGAALVEGRGEQVRPLPDPIGSPPGVLLVTPAVAVPTPDVFAAYAAGIRPEGAAASRLASEHLATELERGLSATALLDRAGILAAANDLAPATAAVVPALVPLRRALRRSLGRPVGQSGSGPTLWAIYPSLETATTAADLVATALSEDRLPVPGDGPPHVIATTFLLGRAPSMNRHAISTNGAPGAIGPYSQAIGAGRLVFCSGQVGLDPVTGDLRRRHRGPGRPRIAEPGGGPRRGRAHDRRRRQDDLLPGRHGRFREPSTRSTPGS